nr:immunoglobulin heavy chain junction region [Homo sapiens]
QGHLQKPGGPYND